MRRQFVWGTALGIGLLGCSGQDTSGGEALGSTSQAVRGHGSRHAHGHHRSRCKPHDHKPRPCELARDPAFALPIAACESSRLVGTAVREDALVNDATYASTLANEFSYVTPENAMKWGSLQPADDRNWSFANADLIVASARSAKQAIKGHALVWHQQLPPWVNDSMSASQLRRALDRHIDKVVSRYRGDVRAWDVVNEAIADDGTLRDSVFSRKFGRDFIPRAFEQAHAADGRAKLIYNDYGIDTINAKSDAVYDLVKWLKRKRVPIDGVGFQMHLDARNAPSEAAMRENFERFAELGLSVNVSELDVRVADLIGSRAEKLAVQKQIYHRVVTACAATPKCEAITSWGFTDRYSWIDSTFGADDPLPFDDAIARKPAYYAMVDGFVGLEPDPEGMAPNLIANASFEAGSDGWFGFGIAGVSTDARSATGHLAGLATGRTDTWQGAGTDITALVRSGWVYDAAADVSIAGAASDAVRLTAMITCDGMSPTFTTVAADTATSGEFTTLAGSLTLPTCPLAQVILYTEGPAAGVDLLVDDVELRPREEPLGANLVTNGDFETGVAGWVAWASTLAPSNVAHGGAGSAVVTNRTDTWQGPVYNLFPHVTQGATYKVDGFARIAGAASAPVGVTIVSTCNGSDSFTSVATATATDTGFVALSGSYFVPHCNLSRLEMYFEGPPAGVDLIVDDVSVRQRLSIPVEPPPVQANLVGNGGFESGAAGWVGFGSGVAQTTTFIHSGAAAGVGNGRTASWQGPSHLLPSGPASYQVGLYALQNSGSAITLALSAKLTCGGSDSFLTINALSSASGAWTNLQGTLSVPAGCTAAQVYVQQFDGATFPDIYVDDLVVNAISVTNFSGNPGFESGTSGWYTFGGPLAQTTAFVHSGSFAGLNSGRSASFMGPAFSYPTGAGSYSASLYALQNSVANLPFVLSAKLSCNGSDSFPTVATANGPSGTWVELAGTFTVPSGCTAVELFLQQSGGAPFPDIYVDDLVALPVN
jgi:endo-1,4-beta-xylanase